MFAFDLSDQLLGLLRHLDNQYNIVVFWGVIQLVLLLIALAPWIGAWLNGRNGFYVASALAGITVAVADFSWLLSSQTSEVELQWLMAASSAVILIVQLAVLSLSSWAANRWLRRNSR